MTRSRIETMFPGKVLGTASGWDGDPGEVWWVYDFEPNDECELPKCECLQFNELEGRIHTQTKDGTNLQSFEIEWVLKAV